MHTDRPVTRLFNGAAPGKRPGLRVFLMFLLGVGLLSATALAAPPPGSKAQAAPAAPAAPASHAEFVGADTCATCHADVAKNFATNPHSKMALMHGNADGVTCENCHGAGSEHVAGGGDVTKIFDPAKASTKDVDTKCLSCHAGAHPNFDRSPHAKANVGCTSCHSIHGSKEESLLKAPQPTLCFQCHGDVKPAFGMPFHHQVNEGLIKCSDCHDVHGTFENSNLKSTADQNAICTKCHTDVRGPFVYEHVPVKAEGCIELPLAPWFAERAAAEHAEHQHALQPVPQPGFVAHDHGHGPGIGGAFAVHQLPHLHSRFEHQRGISPIGDLEIGPRAGRTAQLP